MAAENEKKGIPWVKIGIVGLLAYGAYTFIESHLIDTSWLWTTNSTGGAPRDIGIPPQGDTPNGAANIPISTTLDHHVFGAPTISYAKFAEILQEKKSPAYPVAAEIYGKAEVDGVDPAFILALFIQESNCGTDHGWAAAGTDNIGNELYNPTLSNTHAPYYTEYTNPNNGFEYMDYSRWGEEGWVVSTGYTDGWLGWARDTYGTNNAGALAIQWSSDDGAIPSIMDQIAGQ